MANKSNKLPLVYCFLDTNILHHFQTFDEVDWPTILNAKQVYLILAPVVLRELDNHKDDYHNERRRNRARMLLTKLKSLLEQETNIDQLPIIRRNVSLIAITTEPLIDWSSLRLDPTVNDDRLLASIFEFESNLEANSEDQSGSIILLADDFPLRLKAKSHKIQALLPEGLLHYIEPPSAHEAKIRALEQRLQEATDRKPKLKVGFSEKGEIVGEITRSMNATWIWESSDTYIQDVLDDKRESMTQILARADQSVGQDEVQKFIKEYETYLAELEPALRMRFIKDSCPCCMLEFTVINEGTASAHEVSINFTFPEGSSVITPEGVDSKAIIEVNMPREPAIPAWALPPTPLKTHGISVSQIAGLKMLATSLNQVSFSSLTTPVFHPPGFYRNWYSIDTFPFNKNVIADEVKKLGHHMRMLIKPMFVYLPPSAYSGFSITYSMLVEEIPDRITGTLKVCWK